MEFSNVGMADRTVVGSLKLKLTADLDRFFRDWHRAKGKFDSFKMLRKMLRKLPINLRTKLRNAIWRHK